VDRPTFDDTALRTKVGKLEVEQAAPDFWNEPKKAEKISRELADAKRIVETWDGLATEQNELAELIDMTDESDTAAIADLRTAVEAFEADCSEAELTLFLNGEFDDHDAIMHIHVGAGGVDAADWAGMLLRMYLRFAEQQGWKVEILEKSDNEEGGIKSASVKINGSYVYGHLKSEKGAHRLVRKSPFNSAGSRETSFTQVEVLPAIDNDSEIAIHAEDLQIDTFCASGAGGQHVNRTESAVRITHLPTGIVVSCQTQKSQHRNRDAAMEMLRGKLAERQLAETEARNRELAGKPAKADFGGDAIRSYILDDRRVKDRRTGWETTNPDKVLDGDLMPLIKAFLQQST